jgi:hypothetical protein
VPGHEGHLLVALAVLVFGGWVALAARRPDNAVPVPAVPGAPPAAALAVASLVAAAAHGYAAPHHVAEFWLYGVFFVSVTLGQVAWAVAVAGPGRDSVGLLRIGVLANLAVLCTWAISRTAGLPVGPHRRPEAVEPVDLAAAAAELLIVALVLVWFAVRAGAARPAPAVAGLRSPFPS